MLFFICNYEYLIREVQVSVFGSLNALPFGLKTNKRLQSCEVCGGFMTSLKKCALTAAIIDR